ncbi:MAG TPA: YqgE/AlgH family protein [Pseudonocardia sp.]|uniref:YqgE/AlgH family protein n=1 Tax=Pseudonocardia sp. TaxID=60912 RepID=UPI002B4B1376|nr:YqgE/AlgH family protein [Pseudonocardia sp.]HLU57184.1 YqgE/AlgH family protein [Pseudonocardia sp.]
MAPGTLLVAAPGLLDPHFRRTVIYIIEHRPRGTLGVVLNRPSEVTVRDVLPSWAPLSSQPPSVFVGGPVESETALCLAAVRTGQDPNAVDGLIAVRGPVALVDLDSDPAAIAPRLRGLRVFAGYSGWDAGQLAAEIARGDWIVVPAIPDDVLARNNGSLWGHVLRRQGMPLALLATYPLDLRNN